jgi:hypothetical protein
MFKAILGNRIFRDFLWSGIFILFLYVITHNPIVRPIPEPTPGNWSIQFMQHPLVFGLAGHNYLALRNAGGSVVSELHGLATDTKTGNWKYIGSNPTDLLQVWQFESPRYYLAEKKLPGIILKEGVEEELSTVWSKASACKERINEKRIPYPPYGVSFRNETTNSNSVAYTLAACMELNTRHIGIWTPGDAMNLLDSR